MSVKLNPSHAGVKRIMAEFKELCREPDDSFYAAPCEDNIFEWHFTIRGADDTEYEGGLYHGKILLPSQYPFSPPDIILLTPSGRFEINKKICLSISGYHPKNWQPSWSIRTVLIALIAFFPTKPNGAIGSLDYKKKEKRLYAKKSLDWTCDLCKKKNKEILPPLTEEQTKARKLKPKPEIPLALLTMLPPEQPQTSTSSTPEPTPGSSSTPGSTPGSTPASSPPASPVKSERPQIDDTTQTPLPETNSLPSTSLTQRHGKSNFPKPETKLPTTVSAKPNTNEKLLSYLTVIITIAIVLLLLRKFFNQPQNTLQH